MSVENVKAFYEALQKDTELQEKVNAADAAYTGDAENKAAAAAAIILPIAKEAGFDFTAEELLEAAAGAAKKEDGEISEDELEAVAGGTAVCVILGFGTGSGGDSCGGGGICKYVGIGAYIWD